VDAPVRHEFDALDAAGAARAADRTGKLALAKFAGRPRDSSKSRGRAGSGLLGSRFGFGHEGSLNAAVKANK
jgi:hypothetical protein